MRFRTTLTLAFVGLSLLQVGLVVPLALRNLTALLQGQQERRLAAVRTAAGAALAREADAVRRAMDELAASPALEDVSRDAARVPPPSTVTRAALALMAPRRLSVLALLDESGRTLSNGHLPALLGEHDAALLAVTRAPRGELVPVVVDLPGSEGLVQAPALVTARAVDYGDARLWAVGGVLLDQAWADALSRLLGAHVEVEGPAGWKVASAPVQPPTVQTQLDFPPAATVRVALSRADLEATRNEVLRAFLLLAASGALLALVLGVLLSRRITRPVEALTQAAQALGQGRLDASVSTRAAGELKTLVDTFNRMMADLRATTEKLVASERVAAWQEVARRLAHEVKNPLTPIRMSLETLLALSEKDPSRTNAALREAAPAVLEEVDRLRRIVDEFSRFARLPRPTLQRLDLAELARAVLALYADHPVSPGGPARTYRAELPDAVAVDADRDQLTQVLVNLVKNAEEAMAGQGGAVTVRVRRAGAAAVLEVSDEGPGVPLEARARLFEPYVTTKQGGTGLGLAIAARIAQEHRGTLELAEGQGPGATFRLTLPLTSASNRQEAGAPG